VSLANLDGGQLALVQVMFSLGMTGIFWTGICSVLGETG